MNITGKYLKVWKITENNGYRKLDLGDSKKQKDGSYKNWTWYNCLLAGKAKDLQVQEKDTIEIINGVASMSEYNGKWSTNIVIFEAVLMPKSMSQNNSAGFEDDSIPF